MYKIEFWFNDARLVGVKMYILKRIKKEENMDYARTFVKSLLGLEVPTIYLGDVDNSNRNLYFDSRCLKKENKFIIGFEGTIPEQIKRKYFNNELKNNQWSEANGVYYYYNNNKIIVLDYKIDEEEFIEVEN